MFGNKKETKTQMANGSNTSPSSNSINSLVIGTKVVGSIEATNDIRIDGEVEGDLKCSGKVIIGPQGRIKGEVHCQNAVIEGDFQGILRVKEVLNVRESATISGDIQTNQLLVQAGAVFNVNCNMGGQKVKTMNTSQAEKEVVEMVAN